MSERGSLLFRGLVVAEIVLLVLAFFEEDTGPDPFANMDEGIVAMIAILYIVIVLAHVVSLFGLLMLKNWGSQLFLITTVIATVLSIKLLGAQATFFDGWMTKTGWVVTLNIVYMSQVGHRAHFK